MSETVAIILQVREEQGDQFEKLFKEEILPLWYEAKSQGKFIAASLTPVQDGNQQKEGIRDYILHVEVPNHAEHDEFDSSARFMEFLPKAQAMQPEEPLVWFGSTLFQV
jgi:hypothetical protein